MSNGLRALHYFLALLLAFKPTYAAAETWLCITDMATGFNYNKSTKRWESTDFTVDDEKFIIRRSNREGFAWEIQKFGDQNAFPYAVCKDDFNSAGVISCRRFSGLIIFNSKNGRFSRAFGGSYTAYDRNSSIDIFREEGSDSPVVALGRCSKI